jgi:hypothetical protein
MPMWLRLKQPNSRQILKTGFTPRSAPGIFSNPTIPLTIMGNLKKKRRLKMSKHKRRKRLKANRHKKRTWQK